MNKDTKKYGLELIKILATKSIRLLAIFAVLGFMMVKAPQYHANYIRGKVGSQVFMITNEEGNSGGTGFEVRAKSGKVYTMTNSHVCGLQDEHGIVWASSATMRKIPLHVIEKSVNTDLCILTAVGDSKGLQLADSVEIGEQIGLVGHPRLMPITLSKGELIGYAQVQVLAEQTTCEKEVGMYHTVMSDWGPVCLEILKAGLTNVPALGGNSGSPVVNIQGDVVAVLFAGSDANWGTVVSLSDIKEFLGAY